MATAGSWRDTPNKWKRTYEYLLDLGNIRHNQIILARISDQSSLLATDADGEYVQASASL